MRKFLDSYYRLLSVLLGASVGILIVPVTLQMIARNTGLLPNWIWTEEMARFFFICHSAHALSYAAFFA